MGICIHGRRLTVCVPCKGGHICTHERKRSSCPICTPKAFCKHKRRKSTCRECNGSAICKHGVVKYRCSKCGGGSMCQHNRERRMCKTCDPKHRIGRFIYRYNREAREGGYSPPNITIDEFEELQATSTHCCGCNEILDWAGELTPCLHHDHDTGKVFGFAHRFCNMFEGQTRRLGSKKIVALLINFFPNVVVELKRKK